MEKIELKVLGMMCPHCEKRVVTKVSALDGVVSCEASYKNKKVTIEVDSSKVSKDSIVKTIIDAGYQVK